ncbi:MAG: queuosine precursor transporter [Planctomycetes bacterium]|nr:queuosine precursor transporter [Planctomycetota bacterium]
MEPSRAGSKRETLLLVCLTLFVAFFVTANFLGAKLWEFTLFGLRPRHLGLEQETFVATAGILAFPLTFILTDIVNEYFGRRVVRAFTFLAIAANLVLQPIVLAAAAAPTVSFTPGVDAQTAHAAYRLAFGTTWTITFASLVAFAVAQFVDVGTFSWLRRKTGAKAIWLRAQGSTVVSQLVDTLIVIYVAFYLLPALLGDPHMGAADAGRIALTNYVYKFALAVVLTPLLYGMRGLLVGWLGADEAARLAREAHPGGPGSS